MVMSSVQAGQLISLLINNVLMVITVMVVALAAWLRWRWLVEHQGTTRAGRRRCRWAYFSFLLTVVTLLGMLASLSALALRAILAINGLVVGAMFFFLVSVLALLAALGLWFWDVCAGFEIAPTRQQQGQRAAVHPMALLPTSMVLGGVPRRRRGVRRARR